MPNKTQKSLKKLRETATFLQTKLEEFRGEIEKLAKGKEERIYVPKEIGMRYENTESEHIELLNPLGQGLMKYNLDNSFTISCYNATSKNTGSNYCLKKVKKMEEGKPYFVTDFSDMSNSKDLDNYVICIKKDVYAYWVEHHNLYEVVLRVSVWQNIYEIIKEED